MDRDPLRSVCRHGGAGISHDFRERHIDGQDFDHAADEDIWSCDGVLTP